ncbi:DNA-directed DNA polymerase [Tulasnella sp. JGI-2019a]|nr:DNA-directed DNA polymerase [Tulasnella sp. JGI-2019a]KAG9007091.1 DNA-directed DNA polymerase [Tulasnella sp. JGI-2019a]KAG9033196.1 DNA-directed DNA polymerase [Tulasnella sp. JGI-2019a]
MSTLPLYWKLSSPADEERLSASVDLIGSIERFQLDHTATSEAVAPVNADSPTEGWATHINAATSEDVKYALRRLTRGLASPNESSRLGFAVALTALLEKIPTVTAAQVIFLVNEASEITSSVRGQLLRDMLFARLFGLNCIVEAGLLFKTAPVLNTSTPPATIQTFLTVLADFIWLGQQKTWLREPAWWSVLTVLKGLAGNDVPWKTEAVDQVVSVIFNDPREWSAEKLAVAIQMQDDFPTVGWRKVLSPTFEDGQILALSSLPLVAIALHDMPADENDEAGLKATVRADWKPQPHFAWDIVIKEYLRQDAGNQTQKSSVHDFFRVVVDDSLFGPNTTPERRFWGFQIFRKLVASVPVADLPQFLTKNFMRTWMGHLSSKDKTLHKAARQVADDIKDAVEQDQEAGFSLVMALLGGTDGQFDRLTNSKTVESILGSMDAAGVQAYVDHLVTQAYGAGPNTNDTTSEQDALNSKRLWAIEQLSSTLRSTVIPRDDAWILTVLQFLLLHGFFTVKKKNSHSSIEVLHRSLRVPFPEEARTACRQQTYACLVHLSSAHGKGRSGETSAPATSSAVPDGVSWTSKVIDLLTVFEQDQKHVSLLCEESVDVVSLRKQTRALLKCLPDDGDRLKKGIKLLLQAFLLRSCDESFNALDSFEEIVQAASVLLDAKGSGQKKAENEEEDPEAIDVIADSLIGDLEKGSAYERDTANLVFDLICGALQNSSMDLLLTQLTPRNPLPEEDDGSELDESDIEIEEAGENGGSSDSSSPSSSTSDSGNDGNVSDKEVDPELRKRIAQALQVNEVLENGNGAIDPDDSSDSSDEPTMDDDQMMALDDKLAEIFRSVRGTKSGPKGAQREATIFKTRVVDFIETYIKRNPSSGQIPRILMSLLEIATRSSSDEEQLKQKVTKIIRSGIGQIKEFIADLDKSAVAIALKEVHTTASQTQNADGTVVLISACHYLVRNLHHAGADQLVSDVYMSSLDDAFTKKRSTFPVKVLEDFFKNHPSCAWELRGRLVDLLGPRGTVSSRRQVQVVGLIRELLQGSTPERIRDFIPSFVPAVSDIFDAQGGSNTASPMTTSDLRDVTQSLLTIAKRTTTNLISPDAMRSLWNPKGKLSSAIAKLQGTPRAKSSAPLKRSLSALMELIGATDSTSSTKNSKKRKKGDTASDVHGDDGRPAEMKERKKKRKGIDG